MTVSRRCTLIAILALLSALTSLHNATAKEESRSVSARMGGGSGSGVGIRATPEPGPFTVPEGHLATGFRYAFSDPNSGYSSNQLGGSNIYCPNNGSKALAFRRNLQVLRLFVIMPEWRTTGLAHIPGMT